MIPQVMTPNVPFMSILAGANSISQCSPYKQLCLHFCKDHEINLT